MFSLYGGLFFSDFYSRDVMLLFAKRNLVLQHIFTAASGGFLSFYNWIIGSKQSSPLFVQIFYWIALSTKRTKLRHEI
jgi:hypothetical protein